MKSSKYISILCVGSLLSLASCTDGFESDNKINGSFDDTVKEYDFQKYENAFAQGKWYDPWIDGVYKEFCGDAFKNIYRRLADL